MIILGCVSACKKSSFLNQPPTMQEIVPVEIADYKRLLRNNLFYLSAIPGFGEGAADDYYVIDFVGETFHDRKSIYLWEDGIYEGPQKSQWARPYEAVFYANNVLEGLAGIGETDDALAINQLRGEALFHRAHHFYHLGQIFAPHYQPASALTDLGIPLRLTADVNEAIQRATVQQTYDRIIADLQEACTLLPQGIESRTVPSKEAAHALLSRVYWTMGEFELAKLHADISLALYDVLLDYNDLDSNAIFPFAQYNAEVIYHSTVSTSTFTLYSPHYVRVAGELYQSYEKNDLRRLLFFKEEVDGISYRGSYDGSSNLFFGLAVDELYLIRAESAFRTGDRLTAQDDLDLLLSHRYKKGTPRPSLDDLDEEAFMTFILRERRRELANRGLRWIDLRRLNGMGYNITLRREHEGRIYTLSPGDPRWTFPFPPEVYSFNPGMNPNPR